MLPIKREILKTKTKQKQLEEQMLTVKGFVTLFLT